MVRRMAVLRILVLVCFSVPVLDGKKSQGQYHLVPELRPMLQCNPSLTEITESIVKLFGRHSVGLYATFRSPADYMNLTQISLKVQKCAGGVRTSNGCEHFAHWKFPGACALLAAKGQFWSGIMATVHPPVRCPVGGGGIFKMENATLELDNFNIHRATGDDSNLWIVKVSALNTKGETALCCELEFVYKRVRA